jgi:hypothetical protein
MKSGSNWRFLGKSSRTMPGLLEDSETLSGSSRYLHFLGEYLQLMSGLSLHLLQEGVEVA